MARRAENAVAYLDFVLRQGQGDMSEVNGQSREDHGKGREDPCGRRRGSQGTVDQLGDQECRHQHCHQTENQGDTEGVRLLPD